MIIIWSFPVRVGIITPVPVERKVPVPIKQVRLFFKFLSNKYNNFAIILIKLKIKTKVSAK